MDSVVLGALDSVELAASVIPGLRFETWGTRFVVSDQRPWAVAGTVRRLRNAPVPLPCCLRWFRGMNPGGDVGAERVQRIVGDEAAPDQGPEGVEGFAGVASADGVVELGEEAGAAALERGEKLLFPIRHRLGVGAWEGEERHLVREIEGYAAVAFA